MVSAFSVFFFPCAVQFNIILLFATFEQLKQMEKNEMQYTWHCSREIDRVISGQLDEDVGEWEELVVNSAYLLFHFYCVWDVGVCICYVLGFSSFHSVPRIRFFFIRHCYCCVHVYFCNLLHQMRRYYTRFSSNYYIVVAFDCVSVNVN